MTKEELKARVNYQPIQLKDLGDLKRSTKLTPFRDNAKRPFGASVTCTSNVLAKKNDAAAMAMCKDAK